MVKPKLLTVEHDVMVPSSATQKLGSIGLNN